MWRAPLRKASLWVWLWAGWFTVLTILSSMTHPGPHIDVVGVDKVEHFCYFAVGGVCLGMALSLGPGRKWRPWVIGVAVLLTGAAVGWLDEWHQTFTPGRSGLDVYDWLADVAGSLAAIPAVRWLMRRVG